MKEICKELLRRKFVPQPACACNPCWDSYFIKNRGRYKAAKKALEMFGENTVRVGQMRDMVKDLLAMRQSVINAAHAGKEPKDIPRARVSETDKKVITTQVTRYIKQLKRFIGYESKRFGELVA